MIELLKKDLADSAGILGVLVAVIAAISAWRAPSIVEGLLYQSDGGAIGDSTRKIKLWSALRSLLVLDALLVSLAPLFTSIFIRVAKLTGFNYAGFELQLTVFQVVTVWMWCLTVVAGSASVVALVKLSRSS